jgi:hypothetical protein
VYGNASVGSWLLDIYGNPLILKIWFLNNLSTYYLKAIMHTREHKDEPGSG